MPNDVLLGTASKDAAPSDDNPAIDTRKKRQYMHSELIKTPLIVARFDILESCAALQQPALQ